ncbi:MAG: hypothetical protein P8J27_01515 [Mariniblastus sp.]|nr:hypothetical protein [Mariniblastus sp.]
MIKPLNTTQLSAAKQRTGLQSIGDLIPRLMRQYELQAELLKRREQQSRSPVIATESSCFNQQATFGWYK